MRASGHLFFPKADTLFLLLSLTKTRSVINHIVTHLLWLLCSTRCHHCQDWENESSPLPKPWYRLVHLSLLLCRWLSFPYYCRKKWVHPEKDTTGVNKWQRINESWSYYIQGDIWSWLPPLCCSGAGSSGNHCGASYCGYPTVNSLASKPAGKMKCIMEKKRHWVIFKN